MHTALRPVGFLTIAIGCLATCGAIAAQEKAPADPRAAYIRSHYAKYEYQVPMRDGARLFTAVYVPYDASPTKQYPLLMMRTPYAVGPYGADRYRGAIGPNATFEQDGYIFVLQDVRGRYMSEGEFINMRPHQPDKSGKMVDESSDTYDTIEWLIANLPHHNGRVGMWGISYPGFYTSAGAIDSHPALKAVSPQAPIADWFWDDMHRNGAFVLPMAFNFFGGFGQPRPDPTPLRPEAADLGTRDGYQFFLDLGSLQQVNEQHFKQRIGFWNDLVAHPNYDDFWQARNVLPHLQNIRCAVLTVGGWFDTEDLYGPLQTYAAIERQNPEVSNRVVIGPWSHGGWNGGDGKQLGDADFGFATAQWFRDEVERPFFRYHLKGEGESPSTEATVFETGANRWRFFDAWPPKSGKPVTFYLNAGSELAEAPPAEDAEDWSEFPSDPTKPVPYTMEITSDWAKEYMTEDQRFAAWRPDVLVFRGPVLDEDLTLAGPVQVKLFVSTSQTDADWIVKVVDEHPGHPLDGRPETRAARADYPSGRQQLVRAEPMRGRFRKSFSQPEPFVPGEVTEVSFRLNDLLHTFKRGHRVMIQVQSSWFPFIDRNPQHYVPNIFEAKDSDFVKAIHRVHHTPSHPSHLEVLVLPQ
jgi:putative CocE/NonD family hydrolase